LERQSELVRVALHRLVRRVDQLAATLDALTGPVDRAAGERAAHRVDAAADARVAFVDRRVDADALQLVGAGKARDAGPDDADVDVDRLQLRAGSRDRVVVIWRGARAEHLRHGERAERDTCAAENVAASELSLLRLLRLVCLDDPLKKSPE